MSWAENHICHSFADSGFFDSASPLNGQAAALWDSDPVEFKRLVLIRHENLDEE